MNKAEARKVLGVESTATSAEIKKAYRTLAMRHHPDRETGDDNKFKELQQAHKVLTGESSDVSDAFYTRRDTGREKSFTESWQEWVRGYNPGAEDAEDANSFKEQFSFGSKYQTIKVPLTIEEAFAGCKKNVLIRVKSTFAPKTVTVDIKPGIKSDLHIGSYDDSGQTFLFISEITSRYTFLQNDNYKGSPFCDLVTDLMISPIRMILGGWAEFVCIDKSRITVRIPAGCTTNTKLRLKSQGYYLNVDSHERGDCYLRLVPDIKKINDIPKAELEEFFAAASSSESHNINTSTGPGSPAG